MPYTLNDVTHPMQSDMLYSIGTVARLTGINADTLRVWERRYELSSSHRSPSGRRLYRQTDLEHLQIISSLLANGYKIGEIAALPHKTLEAMRSQQTADSSAPNDAKRQHLLVIGEGLVEWVKNNQSSSVQLKISYVPLELRHVTSDQIHQLGTIDLLAIAVTQPSECGDPMMTELRAVTGSPPTMVCHSSGEPRLNPQNEDFFFVKAPLTTDTFTTAMKYLKVKSELKIVSSNINRLGQPHSRIFSQLGLKVASQAPSNAEFECQSHLAKLIEALSEFETYSSACSVNNWSDAATHACIYSYANQARWLIEKALSTALSAHTVTSGKLIPPTQHQNTP